MGVQTCSRSPSDSVFSRCLQADQVATTPPILKAALGGSSPAAEEHFGQSSVAITPNNTWSPPQCLGADACKVQILHIAETGYDEGLVEDLVSKLGVRANVSYLGSNNHSMAIWEVCFVMFESLQILMTCRSPT